jgi:hypothetical protein
MTKTFKRSGTGGRARTEYITWSKRRSHRCVCGNFSFDGCYNDGFSVCDAEGNSIDPRWCLWPRPLFLCSECERIIDFGTFEVVGRRNG